MSFSKTDNGFSSVVVGRLSKKSHVRFLVTTALASTLMLSASSAGAADYSASSGNAIRIVDGNVIIPNTGLEPDLDDVVRLEPGDTVTRTGTSSSDAIFISGAGSKLDLDGVNVTSRGEYTSDSQLSALIRAHAGTTVTLTDGELKSTGDSYTRGLFASGDSKEVANGAVITATGTIISTRGWQSDAVHAYRGAVINLDDVEITTTGDISHGLYGEDPLAVIVAINSSITTSGSQSYGAFAEEGATISLQGGTINTSVSNARGVVAGLSSHIDVDGTIITTTGNSAYGLYAKPGKHLDDPSDAPNGEVATIDATSANITTKGKWAYGAFAQQGGEITLNGGTITTFGERAYGILVSTDGVVRSNATIVTTGINAHGVQAGASANDTGGLIVLNGGSVTTHGSDYAVGLHAVHGGTIEGTTQITTHGVSSFGAHGESDSRIDLSDSTIITHSDKAAGVLANNDKGTVGGVVNLTNTNITTNGIHAYGAFAAAGGQIALEGGTITTLNDKGRYTQDDDGSRGYAIYATGAASTISADGTSIRTYGQRAYGAYALDGAQVSLSNLAIETDGFMAYGVYASGAGSVVTANNVNITTNGNVGDAAWAYQGGRLELDGGTFNINGTTNPVAGELANGLVAVGGTSGVNNGVINARNLNITTHGAEGRGLRAGATVAGAKTSGHISLANSVITTKGVDAEIGNISYGSSQNVTNSVLISEQGVGFVLVDNATLSLTGTRVQTAQESIVSTFEESGQSQTINVEAGSDITANNGTLLRVSRGEDGGDGVVTLNLASGSTTKGDIIDLDLRTIGGTDVYLDEGAVWSGNVQGVRHFHAAAGSNSTFEGDVSFEEEFVADGMGSSFTFNGEATFQNGFTATSANIVQFSKVPGVQTTIETDLNLSGGSTVAGGSIQTPVLVTQNVVVSFQSIFNGNFTVLGHVSNEGATGPGNSIGSHTYGSVTWGSDHVYNVEVDGSGASDLVTVTGTAKIAGTVKLTPLDGYLVGTPYTILKAGTIEGRFNDKVDFVSPTVFLTAVLQQRPTDVQLSIERSNVTFASVAKTENQAATAGSLDKMAISNPIVSAIAFNSADKAVSAFDQLSGEVHASAKAGLIETGALVQSTINNRLRAAFDGVAASSGPLLGYAADGSSATQPQAHGIAVWGSGFGAWGRFNGTSNVASTSTSSGGFVAGLDGALNDAWRLGVVAGYSRSSISTSSLSSSAKSDNYHLGIYGGAEWENVGFRTGVNYTWHKLSSNRSVSFANINDSLSASYSGGTFQAFGELGYKVEVEKVKFEPFANLSYASLHTNSFTETGNAAALSVAANTTSVTFMTLGARAETKLDFASNGARLHGMIGWRHAFGNVSPTSTHNLLGANPFVVSGLPIAKNSAVVEAGLDFNVSKQAALGISYTGQFGSGSHQNGFNAKFSAKF